MSPAEHTKGWWESDPTDGSEDFADKAIQHIDYAETAHNNVRPLGADCGAINAQTAALLGIGYWMGAIHSEMKRLNDGRDDFYRNVLALLVDAKQPQEGK